MNLKLDIGVGGSPVLKSEHLGGYIKTDWTFQKAQPSKYYITISPKGASKQPRRMPLSNPTI